MKLNGELAYVPQQAWIFSGTVKENVVFGETFDADRFGRVVEACALTGLVTNSVLFCLHFAINEQCRKMRAIEGLRVSSMIPSRVRDRDTGVAGWEDLKRTISSPGPKANDLLLQKANWKN